MGRSDDGLRRSSVLQIGHSGRDGTQSVANHLFSKSFDGDSGVCSGQHLLCDRRVSLHAANLSKCLLAVSLGANEREVR